LQYVDSFYIEERCRWR